MKTAVETAHATGRKVAAHAHGTQGIKDAVRAGVDSIEHGSLIDAEIAGRRTLISHRPDLFVSRVAFRTDGVELAKVRIADLVPQS